MQCWEHLNVISKFLFVNLYEIGFLTQKTQESFSTYFEYICSLFVPNKFLKKSCKKINCIFLVKVAHFPQERKT